MTQDRFKHKLNSKALKLEFITVINFQLKVNSLRLRLPLPSPTTPIVIEIIVYEQEIALHLQLTVFNSDLFTIYLL